MIKNKEKFDKVIKKVVDKINLEIPVNEDIKNEILILDEYFYEKAGFNSDVNVEFMLYFEIRNFVFKRFLEDMKDDIEKEIFIIDYINKKIGVFVNKYASRKGINITKRDIENMIMVQAEIYDNYKDLFTAHILSNIKEKIKEKELIVKK
ncbi:MAG: hypothetical protein PHQ64_03520 [Bacilli bacterium]|nr:hypothetical protein [Bacilli bacterium]